MSRPRTRKVVPTQDRAFAMRLQEAIEGNPNIPEFGRGQQTWFRDRLEVSAEAVRKWFTGESRPRPAVMKKIASLLGVDEAWLSLGIAADVGPKERRVRNAVADGAVNVLAGMSQMNGGHVAFPGDKDPRAGYVDLYVILHGQQVAVHVSLAQIQDDGTARFDIPNEYEDCTTVGVIYPRPMRCQFIQLPRDLIKKHHARKGGYNTVIASKKGQDYVTGKDKWPRLTGNIEQV